MKRIGLDLRQSEESTIVGKDAMLMPRSSISATLYGDLVTFMRAFSIGLIKEGCALAITKRIL